MGGAITQFLAKKYLPTAPTAPSGESAENSELGESLITGRQKAKKERVYGLDRGTKDKSPRKLADTKKLGEEQSDTAKKPTLGGE